MKVRVRVYDNLQSELAARGRSLFKAEKAAAVEAAKVATDVTRSSHRAIRPTNVPDRPGRRNSGRMTDHLEWTVRSDGGVRFNIEKADREARYWIIQEIGTGRSAALKVGGATNPKGRPRTGSNYSRSVKAQAGRALPVSLAFGTGPSGKFTDYGDASGQQLYLRSQLKGVPKYKGTVKISAQGEIQPKGFVRQGSRAGYRSYRRAMIAAARLAFSRPKRS